MSSLDPSNALRATWPATTIVLRRLAFVATRLYKSLGVLVAGSGADLTASLPVVGRALMESVSLIDWASRPLALDLGSPTAGHAVGRRCFLLDVLGTADLQRESAGFEMRDLADLERALASMRVQARAIFGSLAKLESNDSRAWSIEGEKVPGPTRRVEDTGAYLFSAGLAPATHYQGPSMAAHASLGASLGEHIYIDHGERSHHAFVLQPGAVEKWLWYYTVWYRFAVGRCAIVHDWDIERLGETDRAAHDTFRRSIAPPSP